MKTRVLFLCTGNSCRSQMAEGFLRAYGGDAYEAHSAGTNPSTVNPLAAEVMKEIGIDISGQRSKNVGEYVGQHFPLVITVCDNAKEHCPIFPGPCVREHWPFEDPAEAMGSDKQQLEVFRKVRDQIRECIRSFVAQKAAP
ncbi:MAG TPA: arsenate reductase ArsC [Terriglobales bacterium]|nr:arsenate reductase ArsC [Terriglobales bacterium]